MMVIRDDRDTEQHATNHRPSALDVIAVALSLLAYAVLIAGVVAVVALVACGVAKVMP